MLPIFLAALEETSVKLLKLYYKMKKPLAESFPVVNNFTSDGDRYFHYGSSDKWMRKIVKLQPVDGTVSVIELPKKFDLQDSQIF